MDSKKIEMFLQLAGHQRSVEESLNSPELRKLGAQLLLSEVLEYVIKGLGVIPVVAGTPIKEPDAVQYTEGAEPHKVEMLDGLADVAYTMFWNARVFGLPLEQAFELVCDNNLEKFVALDGARTKSGPLERHEWHCNLDIHWPEEVKQVEVIEISGKLFAVGKDQNGKVRKPSSYKAVNLRQLL
ncbi:MAG: hypothetical protein J5J00_16465 [Deltaproteobacteria bacterium]|nr:hypothetical protein [Deltaproteobacteria bacterium]